ncbi:hypothetical protein LTR95_004528 [Oleoguttula sp. CCFEE 5521]
MSKDPPNDRLEYYPALPHGVVAAESVRYSAPNPSDEADNFKPQSTIRGGGALSDGLAVDQSALSLPMQLMAGGASALSKRSPSPPPPTSLSYDDRDELPDGCTSVAQITEEFSIVAECTLAATDPQDAAVVNLDTSEASYVVVKGLLYLLYRDQYDVDEIDDIPALEWRAISLHAEVYVLACKYAMAKLAQVSALRPTTWTRPLNDLTELFHALHMLWTSNFDDRHELRQFFVGYCLPVVRTLMQEAWFKKLMRKTELGADIAIALATGERRDFISCACNRLSDRRGKIRCTECKTSKKKGKKTRRVVSWVETWMRV